MCTSAASGPLIPDVLLNRVYQRVGINGLAEDAGELVRVQIANIGTGYHDHGNTLRVGVSPELPRHGPTTEPREGQVEDDGARLSALYQPQCIQAILDTDHSVPGRTQGRTVEFAESGIIFDDQDIAFPRRLRHAEL
jgi:hypothetical protein